MPRTTRSRLAGIVVVLGLALTGCGSDETDATAEPAPTEAATGSGTPVEPSDTSTPAEAPEALTIDITFDGDEVEPNGVRREVPAGEPFQLRIEADAPGEIHVHSSPEQVIGFTSGTTVKTLKIDQPGVVEVESHATGTLILQLEVR